MTKRRSDTKHLDDALEHLRVLEDHLERGGLDDVLVRDAVSHRLEVAIEAIARVDRALLQAEAPAEWPKIVAMRNLLAHQYHDLDVEILQNTVNNRLGQLRALIERLRAATLHGEDALATFAERLRAAGQADLEEFESIRHTSRDV